MPTHEERIDQADSGLVLACLAVIALALAMSVLTWSPRPMCWTEPKPGTNYPAEEICGDLDKAPQGAYNFTEQP